MKTTATFLCKVPVDSWQFLWCMANLAAVFPDSYS